MILSFTIFATTAIAGPLLTTSEERDNLELEAENSLEQLDNSDDYFRDLDDDEDEDGRDPEEIACETTPDSASSSR